MKRNILTLGLAVLITAPAMAAETKSLGLGVDFSLPYTLGVDNNYNSNTRGRGNFNAGIDGRYFVNENWNLGARVSFDVEKRGLSERQVVLTPGTQYHFMAGETWMPYLRGDLPVILRAAPNTAGSKSKQDIGISAGGGLAWNLGNAIGMENMLVRYDFDFQYTFGLGDALPVTSLEFFKIGFDYRF